MTLPASKELAVLQGAFLLAEKLCLPSSLSSLGKADWSRVGRPVLEAVGELGGGDAARPACWTETLVCALWLKLLSREAGEDVEASWRENPLFPLQRGLPDVSHAVLLEAVRSLGAAGTFARLLSHLPPPQICAELERLARHATSSPAREDDARLFLEVWRELWKGHDEQAAGREGSVATVFSTQFARLSSKPSAEFSQAAKRLKLDPADPAASSAAADVLHVLLQGLKDLKDHMSNTDLCLDALSVSLDALHTAFLIDQAVVLSPTEKLHILSKTVSVRERNDERLTPELIREAQTDLCASHTPSRFQPSRATLGEALQVVTEVARLWQGSGLLKTDGSSYSAFRLEQSVHRVLTALRRTRVSEPAPEETALRVLLEPLAFAAVESSPGTSARVAALIVTHRLRDHHSYALLFAGEEGRAAGDQHWIDCIEKNRAAFQSHDALVRLSSALMSKLRGQSADVSQCRRLLKAAADVFSALSLTDKNEALAAMLRRSSRGFFAGPFPSAISEGFEQELNMAFNCIIQGGGAASQGNLNTAASLVARVAFQNPEAALRACCHSAVFNKGTFSLMVKILQQLPGLAGRTGREDEAQSSEDDGKRAEESLDDGKVAASGSGLLCSCLQEVITSKPLSASEREQFLKCVGLLMMPVEGEDGKRSLVLPEEVVNAFVLPNLSTLGRSSCDAELSLQLLHAALCADVQEPASSPHWVMGCSPFPLLYVLAQLYSLTLRCWEQTPEGADPRPSMDTRELLLSVLAALGPVVGAEVAAAPGSWSRALFWLYNKVAELDWSVRFYLKPVWGEHFKNEVPSSLLAVCDLPEQEWSGVDLPQYGQGTGLLVWMECCSISDPLCSTMLSHLSLDRRRTDHMGMFSKGVLVALTQVLPWCSLPQWSRLLGVLRELLVSGCLHVPFSLEYVDYLPLLDLRRFSCELRLSVLLLRVLQLLCGSSCSHWLSEGGWGHVGRLYAHSVKDLMGCVRAKLPLPPPAPPALVSPKAPVLRHPNPSCNSVKSSKMSRDGSQKDLKQPGASPLKAEESHRGEEVEEEEKEKEKEKEEEEEEEEEETETAPSQEVLFVLSQLFCHVQHIQVMMPGGQCEPLFLSSLDILSHYQAVMAAFPDSSSPAESDNTRHFFSTITDNLDNREMKAALQQKIAQLVSAAA